MHKEEKMYKRAQDVLGSSNTMSLLMNVLANLSSLIEILLDS